MDSELSVDNAESEYVDMLIEKYLDADEKTWTADDYQAPEGFLTNKMGALRRFASAWFRGRIDQAYLPVKERPKADFNLSLLSRYLTELDDMMQKAAATVAQLNAAPPGQTPTTPLAAVPAAAA